jgi:hypothetical protein
MQSLNTFQAKYLEKKERNKNTKIIDICTESKIYYS